MSYLPSAIKSSSCCLQGYTYYLPFWTKRRRGDHWMLVDRHEFIKRNKKAHHHELQRWTLASLLLFFDGRRHSGKRLPSQRRSLKVAPIQICFRWLTQSLASFLAGGQTLHPPPPYPDPWPPHYPDKGVPTWAELNMELKISEKTTTSTTMLLTFCVVQRDQKFFWSIDEIEMRCRFCRHRLVPLILWMGHG